jgi:hypothetical protein
VNSELLRNSELETQYIDALITIKLKKDRGSQTTQGIHGTQGSKDPKKFMQLKNLNQFMEAKDPERCHTSRKSGKPEMQRDMPGI